MRVLTSWTVEFTQYRALGQRSDREIVTALAAHQNQLTDAALADPISLERKHSPFRPPWQKQ